MDWPLHAVRLLSSACLNAAEALCCGNGDQCLLRVVQIVDGVDVGLIANRWMFPLVNDLDQDRGEQRGKSA